MALHKTRAVVIGRRAFGESDRLVDFYTREYGKVRGIARAARRPRSRFGSALELFTLGEMVFFDSGRSELVQVDHFDIVRPFVRVRENLERLGQGAWAVEMVARLCGRVVVMAGGRHLTEGAPADVARNPDVIEAYLGVAA